LETSGLIKSRVMKSWAKCSSMFLLRRRGANYPRDAETMIVVGGKKYGEGERIKKSF